MLTWLCTAVGGNSTDAIKVSILWAPSQAMYTVGVNPCWHVIERVLASWADT